MSIIRLLLALCVTAFSLPAAAVKVTVHNHGHYFVSFEVNIRHSGSFGVGQSRTMDNASGLIRLNWLPGFTGFTWCSDATIYIPPLFASDLNHYLVGVPLYIGKSDINITFAGDIFNPSMRLEGFDIVRLNGFDSNGDRTHTYFDLNRGYFAQRCIWRI